ncbi:hypothetical protein NKH16_26425 [Mesorhizobium sp. M1307]|uniref:hypothetical protein n=1 Tax=Mesorhizobium sp. M1307 TaxID=2957079 RepID=UPI00333BFB65
MYVRILKVSNMRSVAKGRLDLVYPGRQCDGAFRKGFPNWPPKLSNVNVLLGINGAGKSTMLDAIPDASPYLAQRHDRWLVRHSKLAHPGIMLIVNYLLSSRRFGAWMISKQ